MALTGSEASDEDYDAWQETIYLLRSPANARRLMEAVARDREGRSAVTKTVTNCGTTTKR
ncbi:type II toxin-antitoxin system Phd/YefM family antitoxin [Streptomyces sp. KL116D]|uniref:type II toxin-antitoxin system Phd/YefM family antitoxin n=1 Tax=Streptomyces sp. KL116D TaxID=3045152 RepID=UPI0035578219